MNKYRDKSDFEINKAVAEKLGEQFSLNGNTVFVMANETPGIVTMSYIFDPCNDPADAMSIVIENGISLISDWNEIGVWGATNQPWFTSENKNPLRAAMEVFLMMKEAENEKV